VTSQQPEGQLVASQRHIPPWQRWPVAHALPAPQPQPPSVRHESVPPAGHAWQAAPLEPHAAALRVWQTPPSAQQPLVQEIESQLQAPFTQRWPVVQAGPLPQPQVPPEQVPPSPQS
jgi:hypothetical protein